MSEPFLAEIRIVGFDFAPRGWAQCDGQILQIVQNQALFSLLGTTYGGNGRVTFALPDLRGRVPAHFGTGRSGGSVALGQRGGAEQVAVSETQLPAHTHVVEADAAVASADTPSGNLLAKQGRFGPTVYAAPANLQALSPDAVGDAGGGAGHDNVQPFLVLNFVIALQGLFPSRS